MKKGVVIAIFGILGLILGSTETGWTQDDPNMIRENGRTYYVVQEGDTLWDISQKFLNSPYHWPDLWKVNSDVPITNPHRIYPGQRIRLYRKGEEPMPAPMARAPEPPPTSAPPPPAPSEPPPPAEGPGVSDIGGDTGEGTFRFSPMEKVGFIREDPEPPLGFVFRAVDRKEMISYGDRVYLRETGNTPLAVGKPYTIYRTIGPILDANTGEPVGTQHIPTGVLEVIEKKADYAVANVIRAYRDIRVNDQIMPFENRSIDLALAPGVAGLDGRIITSEERNTIYGEHDVVFINRGQTDGVEPGQQYTIFTEEYEPVTPDSREKMVISPIDIGRIVVVHTEPTTATAVITRSSRTIRPGAMLRSAE